MTESASKEAELAKARKEIAEHERDQRKAELEKLSMFLPTSDTRASVVHSNVEKNSGYLSELLAYRSVRSGAKEIVDEIQEKLVAPIVILVDQFDFAAHTALHKMVVARIESTTSEIQKVIKVAGTGNTPKASSLASIAIGTLGAASDILAFFRKSISVSKVEFEIPNQALLLQLARVLSNHSATSDKKVLVPTWRSGNQDSIGTKVQELLEARDSAVAIYEQLKSDYSDEVLVAEEIEKQRQENLSRLGALESTKSTDVEEVSRLRDLVAEQRSKLDNLQPSLRKWNTISSGFEAMLSSVSEIISVLSESGSDKRSVLDIVSMVDAVLSHENSQLLQASILSHGGEVVIAKRTLARDKVTYLGGTVVGHVLLDEHGFVASAGTHSNSHTGHWDFTSSTPLIRKP